jgi:hypothetical protein
MNAVFTRLTTRLTLPWALGLAAALSLGSAACATNPDNGGQLGGTGRTPEAGLGGACGQAAPGCACPTPGAFAQCKQYELHSGDYTTCSVGTMVCEDGTWSSCASPSSADKLVLSTGGIRVDGLGTPTACPFDPCDVSGDAGSEAGTVTGCNQVLDTPNGLDAGPSFTITDAGLTPKPDLTSEAGVVCTGIAVNPPTLAVTVTSFSPLATTPANAMFTASYVPAACFRGLANASWSVDHKDLAAISNGDLTLVSAVAGPINVSAYSEGFQASAVVNVVTQVTDSSAVTTAVANQFNGPSTTPDSIKWLYPYAATIFPRSIAAPVVQYDNLGTAASAVKVTIQYPATGTPIFTVAKIVPEPATPQVALDQTGWGFLDQTAAGNDALISIQRIVGGVLRVPVTETIHFATAALRGNIFYTEYDNDAWTATVKSANPGGTTPAKVALDGAGCNPCHSVSANGTMLVSSNWGNNDTSIARVNGDGTLTGIGNMWNEPSPPAQDSRGFAYSAISPDGQYSLQGANWWGNTLEPGSSNTAASAPHGNGSGLSGAYYSNLTQTAPAAYSPIDSTIDFTFGNASPAPGITAGSSYSVTWNGYVQAVFSETYTFETESSDGVKLVVGGTTLINQFNAQTDKKFTGTVAMTAGSKVPISLTYENVSNTAQVHLRWSSAHQPYQIIPVTQLYPLPVAAGSNGLHAAYYNNITNGPAFNPSAMGAPAPTTVRLDPTVNFTWNGAVPATGVGGSNFGAEWTGNVTIPCTGNYQFCVTGDDGVRLWIDGVVVDDGYVSQGATTYCSTTTAKTAGSVHSVRMDYFQGGGGAVAQLSWNTSCTTSGVIPTADLTPVPSIPAPTTGLTGTYYSNIDFTGSAVSELDSVVDFSWNGASPAAGIPGSNFSAEWTGQVQIPCTGNYQFCVVGDDGVRLWLDGVKIDDGWYYQGATSYCNNLSGSSMAETAGAKHDIKMDYFQGSGGAVAQLQWSSSCLSGGQQDIPNANLFPTGDQGTGGYDVPFHNAGDLGTGAAYSILQLPQTVGGAPVDVSGSNAWGLGTTAMMVPAFAPDGSKLVFVDGDTSGGASWRQGLSIFNFNEAGQTFSARTNVVNTVKAGNVIRWPAFESDSRSVIYQTNPTTQDDAQSYAQYGGMLPSGYSSIPGKLWSVDTTNPNPVSLDAVNAGLGGIDSNQSYQPTVLPASVGGYRWTVFTSDREYGNTQNVPGSGQTATTQLWVGALDDQVSGATDRSHPPFWLSNQVLGTNGGRIRNERAYWVLDACNPSLANLNPPSGSTPPPFNITDVDIGNPGVKGSEMPAGTSVAIKAGGGDIWNNADQFNFAYVPVTGDFQVITHVSRLDWSDQWAKAGLMLRDNLSASSAFAMDMVNAAALTGFQWRTTNGNGCNWTQGPTMPSSPSLSAWLRLTRTGNVVTSDASVDGTTWTSIGTLVPTIGNSAYVGLAVTAHNNGTSTTAVFDSSSFVSLAGTDTRPASLCQDDQDCCGALTTPPTAACQVDVPITSPVTRHCILLSSNSCVALGNACVSDTDCCGFPTNHCDTTGKCAVPPPPFPYKDTVYTRDYAGNCPVAEVPRWEFFFWDATTPGNSDIKFSVGTATDPTTLPATIGAAGVVPLGQAPMVPPAGAPKSDQMADNVNDALKAGGQPTTYNYVRVFADFQPTSDLSQIPTLQSWWLQYDCVAAE